MLDLLLCIFSAVNFLLWNFSILCIYYDSCSPFASSFPSYVFALLSRVSQGICISRKIKRAPLTSLEEKFLKGKDGQDVRRTESR